MKQREVEKALWKMREVYQMNQPVEIKRGIGSLQAERIILQDKLDAAKKKYAPLKRKADAAANAQMLVYNEIRETELLIETIDNAIELLNRT